MKRLSRPLRTINTFKRSTYFIPNYIVQRWCMYMLFDVVCMYLANCLHWYWILDFFTVASSPENANPSTARCLQNGLKMTLWDRDPNRWGKTSSDAKGDLSSGHKFHRSHPCLKQLEPLEDSHVSPKVGCGTFTDVSWSSGMYRG